MSEHTNERLSRMKRDAHEHHAIYFLTVRGDDQRWVIGQLEQLRAENERLREACRLSLGTIDGLADQQAMKDDSWKRDFAAIQAALSSAPREEQSG